MFCLVFVFKSYRNLHLKSKILHIKLAMNISFSAGITSQNFPTQVSLGFKQFPTSWTGFIVCFAVLNIYIQASCNKN